MPAGNKLQTIILVKCKILATDLGKISVPALVSMLWLNYHSISSLSTCAVKSPILAGYELFK